MISSNRGVIDKTFILSKYGYLRIDRFVGKTIPVWNGNNWNDVTVSKYKNTDLMFEIKLSPYRIINCTPKVTFRVCQNPRDLTSYTYVNASDLKIGMYIVGFNYPKNLDERCESVDKFIKDNPDVNWKSDYEIKTLSIYSNESKNEDYVRLNFDNMPHYAVGNVVSIKLSEHSKYYAYCTTRTDTGMAVFNGILSSVYQ